MRRTDREVTDNEVIDEIIRKCECLRLALNDGDCPYVVPLNFGFEHTKTGRIFYFHGADAGKKKALIEKSSLAGFELDRILKIVEGPEASDYTCRYESVIGTGKVAILADFDQKKHALDCIMASYSNKADWKYPEAMVKNLLVIKLEVETISCKANRG